MNKCILACDERGTTSLTSSSRTYAIGGFAADERMRDQLIASWNRVKIELCGKSDVELKWSHFFSGHHQTKSNNPLLSKNPEEWREQALWALHKLFSQAKLFPITTVVQKDKLASDFFLDEKQRIDVFQVFSTTVSQFSRYLKENNRMRGEIWFDQLGSRKEEERWQGYFTAFRNAIQKAPPSVKHRKIVMRIKPEIKFYNSATEPFIQLADFVSGVIWATSEGDDLFFSQLLEKYAPNRQRTYGIVVFADN